MLRRIATGRGAAMTVAAALVVAVLLWLGQWQWQRSRPEVIVSGLPTVDVASVLVGSQPLLARDQGRRVSVTGTWRADRQVLVADRDRPGTQLRGRWVVTAVELPARAPGRGDAAVELVPVVRGWVAESDPPVLPPAPTGPARVEGWVQASEALDVPVTVVQPEGVVALLAGADLVNRWPESLADGFVITDPATAADTVLTGVDARLPGPVEQARDGRDWRNVAYAGQWWVFAGFAVVLWWRALRDATQAQEMRAGP